MATVTLATLRARAQKRADMENSSFVADAEWNDFINASIAELHDLLVTLYEDHYIQLTPHTFTTVSGTADYALPADFYKLKGVDAKLTTNDWENVRKFQFENRNRKYVGNSLQYRVLGTKMKLSPTPTSAIDFQIWYIPIATVLTDDSDTLDDFNQYSEYVIVDAAIKALNKEESDPSALILQKRALIQRINSSAATRDENESETVTDVSGNGVYDVGDGGYGWY